MTSLLKLAAILLLITGIGIVYNVMLPAENVLHSKTLSNASGAQEKPIHTDSSSFQEPVSSYQDVERGSLFFVNHSEGDKPVTYRPGPLLDTQVNIDVTGIIARTRVSQTFHNPGNNWVNGLYAFPLPENAAVDRLLMQVGERIIEGQIHPKESAKNIYERAKKAGKKASLIEQQRPNLFTNSVANIGPGESIIVTIEYQQTVEYKNSQFSLRFPMTIAPRYLPATPVDLTFSKDGWAQANRLPAKLKYLSEPSQFAETRALDPEENSSKTNSGLTNGITLKVTLQVGFALSAISSRSHPIKTHNTNNDRYQVNLQETAIANRDFVLQWQPQTGITPAAAHFSEHKNGHEYGLIMLMPPQQDITNKLQREVVFVIDTSGSMEGESIIQAKQALILGITQLGQNERFNIIEFNSQSQKIWPVAIQASETNKNRAIEFVRGLNANGGTEMAEALYMALAKQNLQTEAEFLRQVIFITDGSVSNEESLMQLIHQNLGNSRLFTVGIGSAPNSFFMREAALVGKGTFTYIGAVSQVHEEMQTLLTKLSSPLMQDLHLSFTPNTEFYPRELPDLYLDEPLIISYQRNLAAPDNKLATIKLSGRQANSAWAQNLELSANSPSKGVSVLWARHKIAQLSRDRRKSSSPVEQQQLQKNITETAMEHHLVSQYTSLLAVDVTPSKPNDTPAIDGVSKNRLPDGWLGAEQVGMLPQTATSAPLKLLLGSILIGFVICFQRLTTKRRVQAG